MGALVVAVGCSSAEEGGGIDAIGGDTGDTSGDNGTADTGEDTDTEDTDTGEDTDTEDTDTGDTDTGGTDTGTGDDPQCVSKLGCLDHFPEIGACEEPDCVDGQCILVAVPDCCQCTDDSVCGDGDPCTEDFCTSECGECTNAVIEGCCVEDADCADGDPCTSDACVEGQCAHTGDLCCSEDEDCNDDDPCTFDFCEAGACVHEATSECCQTPLDCDDGDACTVDVCNPAIGVCTHTPLDGCCVEDAECDDGDPCSEDACTDSQCSNTPGPCCADDGDCDDGKDCTTDVCAADGSCSSTPIADCCEGPGDCDDSNPCTADVCFANQCLSSDPEPGCCVESSDCEDDSNPCTGVFCEDGQCVAVPVPGPCCESDGDCDDGSACTADSCDENGQCSYETVDGCCDDDADCDDGDVCTFDLCFADQCLVSDPAEGCCNDDAQCADDSVCTADSCNDDNICVFAPVADLGCCDSDADCDDADPSTLDSCDADQCVNTPDPGYCLSNEVCDDAEPCTTDTCTNGECTSVPVAGCCLEAADCDDSNSCTVDTCQASSAGGGVGVCAYEAIDDCCDPGDGEVIAHIAFTPGVVDGVDFDPQSPFIQHRWREDENLAFAGPASMYFGNSNGNAYCGGGGGGFGDAPDGTATMPVTSQPFPDGYFFLPAGTTVQLEFEARLDHRVDENVDVLVLNVLAGDSSTPVWDKSDVPADQYGEWVSRVVDLTAFAGSAIRLQWSFDVVNDDECSSDNGDGPRIDEVVVKVSDCLQAETCASDADCTDPPSECFDEQGTCDPGSGECSYTASGACCEAAADCDDGNGCTYDNCIAGSCLNLVLPGCCNNDSDCEPDSPCQVSTCEGGFCGDPETLDGEGCCESVDDCAGAGLFCGDSISCDANTCVESPTDKQTTHMEFVFTDQVDGWTPDPFQGQFVWRENPLEFTSEPLSAYFGAGASNFGNTQGYDQYCSGGGGPAPSGTASFPGGAATLDFDASGQTSLSLFVRVDVRKSPDVDTLILRLDDLTTGSHVTLWTRADLADGQWDEWVELNIDLTPYAPFSGKIRAVFDVVEKNGGDAVGHCHDGGKGVYLDDIVVHQTCAIADPGG